MSKAMTNRERWLKAIRFEDTDRPVRFEALGIDQNTILRWQKEGVENLKNEGDFYLQSGFDLPAPVMIGAHLHPGFFPEFELKVLEDDGKRQLIQTQAGILQEVFTDGAMSIPHFVKFPVENPGDWQKILPRLNPKDNERVDRWKWSFDLAKGAGWPLSLYVPGCFGFQRHLMGFENLMVAYVEQPELIHQMSQAWSALVIGVIERARFNGEIDIVYFWEDMCYKNGPMISPKMFKEFIQPYYRPVCDRALELGVTGLCVDTDGDCRLLIPLFVETGINFMLPFEVQAGMDIREVRKKFPKLAIQGGLDKRTLAQSKDAIDAELSAKMDLMLSRKGWIPSLDHVIPPDVAYENWQYYLERIRSWK